MLSAEMRASRERPEPLPMMSSGKSSPRVLSQPTIVDSPAVVVAGVPFISAARRAPANAHHVAEYLLVTRTISDRRALRQRSRAAVGVGAPQHPARTCPPSAPQGHKGTYATRGLMMRGAVILPALAKSGRRHDSSGFRPLLGTGFCCGRLSGRPTLRDLETSPSGGLDRDVDAVPSQPGDREVGILP